MKKLTLLSYLFINSLVFSQLTVDGTQTPQQLVQNILAGPGVVISNIVYNGSPLSIGSFDGSNSNIGFDAGLIMSTENITDAIGPNDDGGEFGGMGFPGDSDIDAILAPIGVTSEDAAILEFDFIPVSDTIKFNYVFASEEYMEYVATINDVFGFFISGPGISGPFTNNSKNIALIPGTTTPVSIQNINANVNGQFYVDNEVPPGQSVQFDGFTVPFQAISAVQCGQTYHLKLVIADASDPFVASGVFLQAGSLSSTDVDFKFASVDGGTEFYEACTQAEFVFSRPSDQVSQALTINIAVSGTATSGVDYTPLTNSIVFAVGVDTVLVPFQTFIDNVLEGDETVTVTADVITICGDTIQIVRTITIKDPIRIDSLTSLPSFSCANSGSTQSFTSDSNGAIVYTWNGPGSAGPLVPGGSSTQNLASGWYYLHVEDLTCEANDSIFVDSIQAPSADLTVGPITSQAPVLVTFSNFSQHATSFEWIFGNGEDTLVNNMNNQSSMYPDNVSYTVTLIASEGPCSDTAFLTFQVISEPSVFQPNIITLNGDSINEYFTLWPENFVSFDYVIFNRWGGVMFEGDLANPKWHGLTENNKEAEEGVYFYKFTGLAINGETKTGQGFFHLKK